MRHTIYSNPHLGSFVIPAMAMSAYNDKYKYGPTMLITSFTALANSSTLTPIHAALRLLEGNERKGNVLKKIQ